MKNNDTSKQQLPVLTFFDIDPDTCTSYWISAQNVLFAYMDGELNTCSEEGEPMYGVLFKYRIKIPSNMYYGHLYRGFFPGLSIEEEPLETHGQYPHMHRYKLFGPALDGEEDVTRWFCMECGLESPPAWDVRDGCIGCDNVTDAITEYQIRGY